MSARAPWVPVPAVLSLLLALALSACGGGGDRLALGATTSLQDTGFLDEIVSAFETQSGYDVAAVTPLIAGSGQVLELARRGEIDVLITHSPEAEQRFMDEGHGSARQPFMQSRFLIVGPEEDLAGIAGAATIAEAFRRIAGGGYSFVSRGDASGTHARELAIWEEAGIDPAGQPWYQESAVGQGQNLLVASDKGAYTLVDSATFAVFRERLSLVELAVDNEQFNVYSVILVNPEKHDDVNAESARAFFDFITSPAAAAIIEDFGRDKYGESLFEPLTR